MDRTAHVLLRLRVELFAAAQLLKGADLAAFKELIGDVYKILDLDREAAAKAAVGALES